MGNRKQGRRGTGKVTALIVALTAALMLAVPAAAATVTASDVMIRNSGQEKDDNIIGVLNKGDTVKVLSKSVDASGIEWYYVELPNKNTGYVKSQWIDNNGAEVETVEAPVQEEQTQTEENKEEETPQEDVQESEESAGEDEAESEGIDDWTEEDADKLAGTPVTEVGDDAAVQEEELEEKQEENTGIEDSQSALSGQDVNSYNPYTDPNAQYRLNFVTEKDGTGSWYVYNYDTDKRISLDDLDKMSRLQDQAQKSAASAGFWRTAACIFLVILIGVLIFLFVVLRRNKRTPSARSGRSRRRNEERRDSAERETRSYDDRMSDSDEDEEYDEFSPDSPDSEEDEGEEDRAQKKPAKKALFGKDLKEKAVSDRDVSAKVPSEKSEEMADSDVRAETDQYSGEEEEKSEDETDEEKPAPRRKLAGLFGGTGKKKSSRRIVSDDEEDDGAYGEDDEEYDDEEYEDDDSYEDDEEDSPRRGGFFGILKNIFHSESDSDEDDSYEDDEEDEDDDPDRDEDEDDPASEDEDDLDDDEEVFEEKETRPAQGRGRLRNNSRGSVDRNRARRQRAAERVFDEALDYPEDADLIPGSSGGPVKEKAAEPVKEKAPDTNQDRPETDSFYADDDDDMEYSFLNSRSKRGSRR